MNKNGQKSVIIAAAVGGLIMFVFLLMIHLFVDNENFAITKAMAIILYGFSAASFIQIGRKNKEQSVTLQLAGATLFGIFLSVALMMTADRPVSEFVHSMATVMSGGAFMIPFCFWAIEFLSVPISRALISYESK